VASFASTASFPLILIGMFLGIRSLAVIGVIIFTVVVVFQLVTLPVEFNASNRAVALLSSGGYITSQEAPMIKKVLGAAGMTYVAAALVSFLNLVRMLAILGMFRDD
jgi:Zn-dependent membrane protease YugP